MFDSVNSGSKELLNGVAGASSIYSKFDALSSISDPIQALSNLGKNYASCLNSPDQFGSKQTEVQSCSQFSKLDVNQPLKSKSTLAKTTDGNEIDTLTGLSKDESLVARTRSISPTVVRTRRGRLNARDSLNPTRTDCYKDDYVLDMRDGGQVQIKLNSSRFNAYLQIVDPSTGRVLAEDDDSGRGSNSQLTLTTQPGVDYLVRVTSYAPFERGTYRLTTNTGITPPPTPTPSPTPIPPTPTPIPSPTPTPPAPIPILPPPDSGRFTHLYGYGQVDANSAVANAVGSSRFADVPDLGGDNWGNDMVQAPEVWAREYTGRGVTVAVVDTGVDYTHSDLDANIWMNTGEVANNGIDDDQNGYVDDIRGWNFVSDNSDVMDDNNHGTHVAGTIAAENNGLGITGVAYDARIMPVKVLGRSGSGDFASVANGIRYAANNGADVINLSLGSEFPSTEIEQAVSYATERGSFVVMAAGNSSGFAPIYPAQYATQYGISVGAIDRNRSLANFSNRAGSDSHLQHVVAPGVDVYSTIPGNRYDSFNGTSMAAPHVAGVLALMFSANTNLTYDEARQILIGSTASLSGQTVASPNNSNESSPRLLPLPSIPGAEASSVVESFAIDHAGIVARQNHKLETIVDTSVTLSGLVADVADDMDGDTNWDTMRQTAMKRIDATQFASFFQIEQSPQSTLTDELLPGADPDGLLTGDPDGLLWGRSRQA